MTFKAATPAQNIDVKYFQTRHSGEWKARVLLRDEVLMFGPASMKTLELNIAQLLRTEAAYADAMIHGAEEEPRTNGGVVCDVMNGPCACGAWHKDGV